MRWIFQVIKLYPVDTSLLKEDSCNISYKHSVLMWKFPMDEKFKEFST